MRATILSAFWVLLVVYLAWTEAATTSTLTTSNGQILDAAGNVVVLKGFALSGFEISLTMTGDLSEGTDSIAHDWDTIMYRAKMMGFNAARIEWSVDGLATAPKDFANSSCTIATTADIQASMLPPTTADTPQPTGTPTLPQQPPTTGTTGDVCSSDLPNTSTQDRYVYMVHYLCGQGFYVNMVYHSYAMAYGGDTAVLNETGWVQDWVNLMTQVQKSDVCKDHLIVDLMNEPDAYGATWTDAGTLPENIATFYTDAMDALYPLCPGCLFQIQGCGQITAPIYANYGDGYCTDATLLGSSLSNPTAFFTTLLNKDYLNQVVIAPHVYGPSVTDAVSTSSGSALYARLSESFGYLNKKGFCSGTTCHVFAVVMGEFNVNFGQTDDVAFWASLVQYLNNAGEGADGLHNAINSFYMWAWDANADDTFHSGGLVASDWETLNWQKLGALIGNNTEFTYGLELIPWYLPGYVLPTGSNSTGNSTKKAASSAKAAVAGVTLALSLSLGVAALVLV